MTYQARIQRDLDRIRDASRETNHVRVTPKGMLTARDSTGKLVAVKLNPYSLAELRRIVQPGPLMVAQEKRAVVVELDNDAAAEFRRQLAEVRL